MKRNALTSLILVVAMLVSMFSMVIGTEAATQGTVSISSASLKAGSSVTLPIRIRNNPGVVALKVLLEYDDDYLSITKVEDLGILGDLTQSEHLTDNPYTFFWMDPLTEENITTNGILVNVTFKVKSTAPNGTYKLDLKLEEAFANDSDLMPQEVSDSFTVSDGTITVTGGTTATDEEEEDDDWDDEEDEDLADPAIKASSTTVNQGNQFNIILTLSNNPGLVSLRTALDYNDDYFKVVKVTDAGILGECYYSNDYTNSPLELFWTDPLKKSNITKTGKIVTLTFACDEDTPAGKYKFTPKIDDADVVNYKLKEIGDDFECVAGTVTVSKGSGTTTTTGSKPNIKLSSVNAAPGGTFDVTLTLSNNPGLISLRTMLKFNDDYFEIAKITDGGVLGTKYFGDVYDESPYELYWTNPLLKKDNTNNGKIATVKFVAKDNVPEGKYTVSLSSDDADILNYELDELGDDFTFTDGVITITKSADKTDETKPVGSEYSVTLSNNKVNIELPVSSVSYGDGMLAVLQESLLDKALAEAAKSYPGKKMDIKAVYSNRTDGDLVVNIDNSYAEKMKNADSFTLETYKAVMTFDSDAISEMAQASVIPQFIFKNEVPKDKLDALLSAEYKYYDVSSSVNFAKGNITVVLPYEAASDIVGKYAVVYAFDGKKLDNIGSSITYTPGKITFTTKKIDSYVVTTKELGFVDIKDHWARDNINYVAIRGIFNGSSETTFSPDAELSRGMLVTVLGRLEQIDVSGYNCMFDDVDKNLYYAPYIEWARKNGIVGGRTETQFDPDASVTRQEMAVIISRYLEKYKGKTLSAASRTFSDADKIPSWSKTDIYKVSNAGIITGVGSEFQPATKATRAQAATILRRIVEFLD